MQIDAQLKNVEKLFPVKGYTMPRRPTIQNPEPYGRRQNRDKWNHIPAFVAKTVIKISTGAAPWSSRCDRTTSKGDVRPLFAWDCEL